MKWMIVIGWLLLAIAPAYGEEPCDEARLQALQQSLQQRLGVWAEQQPEQALRWAQQLDSQRADYLQQGHHGCSLLQQLHQELDERGVAR